MRQLTEQERAALRAWGNEFYFVGFESSPSDEEVYLAGIEQGEKQQRERDVAFLHNAAENCQYTENRNATHRAADLLEQQEQP